MSRELNGSKKTAISLWVERLLRCLAAQSPAVEFALTVSAVLLAGNLPKTQGLAAHFGRLADVAMLFGFFAAGIVGLSVSRSSSV